MLHDFCHNMVEIAAINAALLSTSNRALQMKY